MSNWNQQQQQQHHEDQNYQISKDGVENLKARFINDSSSNNNHQPRSKIKIVGSQQNHLFNSRNAKSAAAVAQLNQTNYDSDSTYYNNNNNSSNQNSSRGFNYSNYNDSVAHSDL